jgi:hypothetical protein
MGNAKQNLRQVSLAGYGKILIVSDEALIFDYYSHYYCIRGTSDGNCIEVKGNRYYLGDIKQWDKTYDDINWHEPNLMN